MVKHVVGVADMKTSGQSGDLIVTHALGSCVGIAIHDPQAQVGGILHAMLPLASASPERAEKNPYVFVNTGVPLLFKELYGLGAEKSRIVVKVAGGANVVGGEDFFAIGKRNIVVLRKLFWKNSIMVKAQDVGGHISRTLFLDTATGRTWLKSSGREWEL